MKLNGVVVKIERESIIPILGKGTTIYLIAKPIESYEPFDELCKRPEPPMGGTPGKERPLVEAKEYREALTAYSKRFNEWITVNSLVEIADEKGARFPIEWEEVDLADIATYESWHNELIKNGFSEADCRRIEMEVLRCNQMDETLIEAAKNHFLAITEVPAST
jgi:hypothetical protein